MITRSVFACTCCCLVAFSGFSQHKRWILGTSEQSSLGVFNTTTANKLKFFEVDFTSGSPVFSQRICGASINQIVSIGTAEALNCGIDTAGKVAFYVFANPTQPFNAGAWTSDTLYFIAYSSSTSKDEVFYKIATPANEVGSTKNIEVINRDGFANQYYVIYKTAANNIRPQDEIRYVVVDMNTNTVSAPVILASNSLNEGMAVSARNCAMNNRWFFFVKYASGNLQIHRSSITSTGISVPVLINTITISGNASGGQNDIEISPTSDKIAFANLTSNSVTNDVTLFDFNLSAGTLSNQRYIDHPNSYLTALQFSPNGKQLYIARAGTMSITSNIYNVTVSSANYTITATDNIIGNLPQTMCIELGYDGKIYFPSSPYNTYLNCITNPDAVSTSNVITQTTANSFGIGNATGFAIPDQIDGNYQTGSLSVQSSSVASSCGGATGSATTSVLSTGGTYLYSWNNGQTTSTSTGLSVGVYTITVTSTGCQATQTVAVTQNAPSIGISVTNINCNSSTGSATASVTNGGTAPYTYSWSGGQTSQTVSGLSAGSFTVTVMDNNGCSQTAAAIVINIPAPTLSLSSSNNVLCNGSSTGSAVMSASSGTSPYTYSWSSGGGTSNSATGLGAGIYTLTVTDANNCSVTQTVLISQPSALVLNSGATATSCGLSNGSVSATASGGTGSLTYSWSPGGASTASITGISSGNYMVTVTDAFGCTKTSACTVNPSTGPALTLVTSSNVLCNGTPTGTATMSGSSGTSPYTYSWNNGQTLAGATGLSAGNYTLTLTDAAGCTQSQTVAITQPLALSLNASATNPQCFGNTGSASVSVSGGAGSYTYSWSSGQSTQNVTGLTAGSYVITVTDTNGCSGTQSVSVTPPAQISLGASSAATTCGQANGNLFSNAAGGSGTLIYIWSPGGYTSSSVSGVASGSYTVTVTDGNGCTKTASAAVAPSSGPVLSVTSNVSPLCFGDANGSASISSGNGIGAYTYSWNNGQSTSTATGLSAGTYTITVTDSTGCQSQKTVAITQPAAITANAGANVTITAGSSTVLNATGGTSYSWAPPTGLSCTNCQSPTANPTVTTTYTLVVTDNNGCTATAQVTVFVDNPCISGDIFVPNVFSPNGDGKNDVLFVYGRCFKSFQFLVFDRWGEKVFETLDSDKGWDGTYEGKPFTTAVFVYHLKALMKDGKEVDQKGNVTLIR